MAHKKKHAHPVPPGNQPRTGPPADQADAQQGQTPGQQTTQGEGSFQEQDPKRRLGDFTGAGENSIKQPGGKNDANH